MNHPVKTVLISGASVAGPTLAYWLNQYGYQVTVVEHAPTLRSGGYGIDLRGAAMEVIKRMNLLETIKASDNDTQGMYLVNKRGKRTIQLNDAAPGNTSGSSDTELMREDLSQALYEVTKRTCEYIWGDSITAIQQDEDGAHVSFERSAPRLFDLVIGADGLHSNTRKLIFGEESQFTRRLDYYIAIFTIPNYRKLDHEEHIYMRPRKTVAMYSARNNTEAKVFMAFSSRPLTYSYRDIDAQKQIIRDTFGPITGWEVQMVLQYMEKAPDFYFDAMSQIRMPEWSKGRVCLLGDAAYGPSPASGQGTSSAVIGAYILASELKAADGDYVKAFAAYQQQMQPFMKVNQDMGVNMAKDLVVNSRSALWFRTAFMHIPGAMSFVKKQNLKTVRAAVDSITLKAYKF